MVTITLTKASIDSSAGYMSNHHCPLANEVRKLLSDEYEVNVGGRFIQIIKKDTKTYLTVSFDVNIWNSGIYDKLKKEEIQKVFLELNIPQYCLK